MLIARANPWFCLGLAFLWLALSAVAPARPDALPAVPQIVFSSLVLYALLLSATFVTAATVPSEESGRRVHPARRADHPAEAEHALAEGGLPGVHVRQDADSLLHPLPSRFYYRTVSGTWQGITRADL